MAVAQGPCPNCGAPTEFSIGSSISKVCPYCRHVILRTDRDWRNLGKAADLANTPTVVSVGDRGTIRSVGFEVVGRIQLDYGRGPWDEFYVSFSDGKWGWLAHAQGNVYVTQLADQAVSIPPATSLLPDMPVTLGSYGMFKVAERRSARVLSSEGELPSTPAPQRVYADLNGMAGAFATIDYGDGTTPPKLFVGHQVPLAEIQVVPRGGERGGGQKVKLANLTCPNCGGALPAPQPGIERVACKYCNAISEVEGLKVIARQAAAYATPKIPLGSSAALSGTQYTVIGYVERSASIDGESFRWFEYLLYGDKVGFRWLVEDEGNWLFVRAVSGGEIQAVSNSATWHGRTFHLRNDNRARVDYVLGEFYWKVEVGETVRATDYVNGADVLSREEGDGEVNWSYSTPVAWSNIARAFNLPASATPWASSGASLNFSGDDSSGMAGGGSAVMTWVIIIGLVVVCIVCMAMGDGDGPGGFIFTGGGGGYGGFGGK